jgi:selenocysteine lyase/cysteine desulfurase
MTTSDELLAELRAPLAGTEQLHLNNAGVSPMTRRARDAGARLLDGMLQGSLGIPSLLKETEAARATFGRLLGCPKDDVAFFQTCASAISQVALGFPFKKDNEIVLVDQEYPSNAYPWYRAAERAGARVVVVRSGADYRVDVNDVVAAITSKTRVVAVSWVQYSTGASVDLRVLADAAHARGAWLVVDAIQGIGVVPFDLSSSGADAVCGGTQKWLLGPVGHGFLALAPGRAGELQPLLHGAMTYGTADDVVDPKKPPRMDPRRFEPGTPYSLGAVPAAASIELLLGIGLSRVHEEALRVSELVVKGGRDRGLEVRHDDGPARSPIVTLLPRHQPAKKIVDEMRARGCSLAPRGGGVRVSPHAHNGPQHIERFFALWDELDR